MCRRIDVTYLYRVIVMSPNVELVLYHYGKSPYQNRIGEFL